MQNNVVTAENLYTDNFKGQIVYCGSNENIKSYTALASQIRYKISP